MKVELISHTHNPEQLVAMAAKLCYSPIGVNEIQKRLTPEKTKEFVNMLMELGHESPLEHVTFTFAVEDVSRSLSHQLVRHRIASYSQQSQRYVKLDNFEYITPALIEKYHKAENLFKEEIKRIRKTYKELVDTLIIEMFTEDYNENQGYYDSLIYTSELDMQMRGKQPLSIFIEVYKKYPYHEKYRRIYNEVKKFEKRAIENARAILPNACETKLVFTMNARSLLNFFKHRCCNRAQDEIRNLAIEMLKLCKQVAPEIFRYAGPECVTKNKCPEGKMSCGKMKEIQEKFKNL